MARWMVLDRHGSGGCAYCVRRFCADILAQTLFPTSAAHTASDSAPLSFLTIPLGDMLVFAILVGSAFYFRRRADTHKRLMLLATIGILACGCGAIAVCFHSTVRSLSLFWSQRSLHCALFDL